MVIKTVIEDDDLPQVWRQFVDKGAQAIINFATLGEVIEVRRVQRRIGGEDLLWRRVGLGHIVPDMAGDAGPGIRGESGAVVGVEVLDSVPEANATSLKQLSVGEAAAVLAADDGVDEAFVVGQAWLVTCRGRG